MHIRLTKEQREAIARHAKREHRSNVSQVQWMLEQMLEQLDAKEAEKKRAA